VWSRVKPERLIERGEGGEGNQEKEAETKRVSKALRQMKNDRQAG
jgi:hypothetical protein